MVETGQHSIWRKFRDLIDTQIDIFVHNERTLEPLKQLRDCLEKQIGKPHVEFRLISFCAVRLLQLCRYLNSGQESKMYSPEDKQAMIREIQDSLLSLELRLGKYSDEIVYRHFNEKDSKYREDERNLLEMIENLFVRIKNYEDEREEMETENHVKERISNVCSSARDLGYNAGEITLSKDMAEILNLIKLVSKSFDEENKANNDMGKHPCCSTRQSCPCPCEDSGLGISAFGPQPPSSNSKPETLSAYTGSEVSLEWNSARNFAERIKQVPKLNFEFLDSDNDVQQRESHVSSSLSSISQTSEYLTAQINNLQRQFTAKTQAGDVPRYELPVPIPPSPSIASSINSKSSSWSRETESSYVHSTHHQHNMEHPACVRSFSLVTRDDEKAITVTKENSFTEDESMSVNESTEFFLATPRSTSTRMSYRSVQRSTQRTISPRSPVASKATQTPIFWNSVSFYRHVLPVAVLVLSLMMFKLFWVYNSSECQTKSFFKTSFYPEVDKLSFLIDFWMNNIEIKHHGMPPV